MSDIPHTIRVSVIRPRWLRRVAIVALYPAMTLTGLALLLFAMAREIVSLQRTLITSAIEVWKLP